MHLRPLLPRARHSVLSYTLRSYSLDEALQAELKRTVKSAEARHEAWRLVEKVRAQSWDLHTALGDKEAREDPFELVQGELRAMNSSIISLITNKHPMLSLIAKYYFELPGKRIRPTTVLLTARALSASGEVQSRQIQLAQIIEMIHTASLVHDDVLDDADQRRGNESVNIKYGNKFAILVGDYLLAKASVSLARLRDHDVTELLSTVIAELVEGEFMQLAPATSEQQLMNHYLRKTYLKTASLISNSTRSAAILEGKSPELVAAAGDYGRNLGMAFQVVDDILDFTSNTHELGKPVGIDLQLGHATAPVLFAAEEYPELLPLIARKFKEAGDPSKAMELVLKSDGLKRANDLAASFSERAVESLQLFPDSESTRLLQYLAKRVVERRH